MSERQAKLQGTNWDTASLFFLETESLYIVQAILELANVDQASLELTELLSLPPKCRD